MGAIPTTLSQLTSVATNAQSNRWGPFMNSVPVPPGGWTTYAYTANVSAGTYTITSAGDGTSVGYPQARPRRPPRRRSRRNPRPNLTYRGVFPMVAES